MELNLMRSICFNLTNPIQGSLSTYTFISPSITDKTLLSHHLPGAIDIQTLRGFWLGKPTKYQINLLKPIPQTIL